MNGNFSPHVRVMQTGYENLEDAQAFGLPLIYKYVPAPFDSAFLNHNWQVFGTNAYSIYSGSTDSISHDMAKQAVLRFLGNIGASKVALLPGARAYVFDADALATVVTERAGILYPKVSAGQFVRKGDVIAQILAPLTGDTLQTVCSQSDGMVFFAHPKPLVHQHSRLFQVLSVEYTLSFARQLPQHSYERVQPYADARDQLLRRPVAYKPLHLCLRDFACHLFHVPAFLRQLHERVTKVVCAAALLYQPHRLYPLQQRRHCVGLEHQPLRHLANAYAIPLPQHHHHKVLRVR